MREGTRPTTLILVKHARPQIIPTAPAPEWRLGLPALIVTDAPGLTEPLVIEQIG